MSATQDLRSCLLSLCEIIENILPNLQKGMISPELFRLAKQDDLEAVKVKIWIDILTLFDLDDLNFQGQSEIVHSKGYFWTFLRKKILKFNS